ncbi:MAG TPA: DoxX family membrane protein [Myxococcales bacterium]|nr:DoxX family membrane protein [Myxococcales bacterium]
MLTPGFSFFLAFLRMAAGISLFAAGMQKLSWFAQPPLEQRFAEWAAHPANAAVVKYLGYVSQHPALFSRLVPIGEIGLGLLLMAGLLTPLASLLAFLLVLNFQFASGQMFSLAYLRGQSGLAYLLVYPVLFFGRAGTALGMDGMISRGMRKSGPPS